MIKDRIKEARKMRKLNQEELAKAASLSRNYIALIELGERQPTERTIKDLARALNVGEQWLSTGEGEMLEPVTREAEIADIAARIYKGDDDDFRMKMVNLILQMNEEELKVFKNFAVKLANEIKDESRP